MIQEDVELLLRWLSIDATTGREAQALESIEEYLVELGFGVERQPVANDRWNLIARRSGPPELLFCTHVDTVPPHFGGAVDAEGVTGRGACDTRGGLVAMLRAWCELPSEQQERCGFLLVVGEEVDHIGAIVAEAQGVAGVRRILLCEPTQNRIAVGQKGILKAHLRAHGRAGHSAFPETGHSAVHALIDACHQLIHSTWPSDPVLGATTLNVGVIEGGVAANVIAASASAEVLFRVVGSASEVEAVLRAQTPARIDVDVVAQNDALVLVAPAGFETDVVPFNTDAPYLQSVAPVILCGPGDIRCAHSPDERINFADFDRGVSIYVRLATQILESGPKR